MMRMKRQLGLSLVELLVALVISLFLLAGIVQVYTGNRATFSFTGALAEVQENGRFALETISQDVRLADEWGCVVPRGNQNINDTLSNITVPGCDTDYHDFLGEDAITGTNGANAGDPDTLIIRGGRPGNANVENPFTAAATQELTVNGVGTFSAGDIILITRCGANDLGLTIAEADINRITTVTPNGGNTQTLIALAANKSQIFENDATVLALQTTEYSIAAGASGEPALFREVFNNGPQELVEGVEDMQILYGVDDDNDQFANQYFTADNVLDFDDVVSVRVMLVVRSIDDFVLDQAQTYTFNGQQLTAPDRRVRQVFTSTIALRNRVGSL